MHLFAETVENSDLPNPRMFSVPLNCRTQPPVTLSTRLCGFRPVERVAVVAEPLAPPVECFLEDHERWDGMS